MTLAPFRASLSCAPEGVNVETVYHTAQDLLTESNRPEPPGEGMKRDFSAIGDKRVRPASRLATTQPDLRSGPPETVGQRASAEAEQC
jgi:hypothetical protein